MKKKFSIIKQEVLMDIGKKIRQLRLQNDLTLEDLAIFAALLDGCFYFHFLKVLFVSERNSSFC